jgi:hypothetical protein
MSIIEETMEALNDLVRSGKLIFIKLKLIILKNKMLGSLYWCIFNVCMAIC